MSPFDYLVTMTVFVLAGTFALALDRFRIAVLFIVGAVLVLTVRCIGIAWEVSTQASTTPCPD